MNSYQKSEELFLRATKVIPEGIYGTRKPGFVLPKASPYFAARGAGGHYWDVDGNEFIDFMCGYGPNVLGHAHPEVDAAVRERVSQGFSFNQPTEEMVELAELMTRLVPIADWAVFAKNGSDVTTWAIRVAREHTERSKILATKGTYHGSHAWCAAYPAGVTAEDKANIVYFNWNDLEQFERLVEKHRGDVAGVIMTPYYHPACAPSIMPAEGFWKGVREICDREGMLIILDDIRVGFRVHIQGSYAMFGIEPDLICHAKAMANGYPIAAAMGTKEVLGAAEAVFISGTYFYSPMEMVAALTTLRILEETDAIPEIARMGTRLKEGLESLGKSHGYNVTVSGPAAIPYLSFDDHPDLYHMQTFCREAIARGVFFHPHHNWYICAAHTDEDIDRALEAADAAFKVVREELGG
ncbi:MAG: aminotransferase class III-fold pyridoxal phosphate-dependent enzyme [Anaerolineae bacterium]|nr:aminotransferase class III-fold pyridoxal phosphate-dependent enzyme [Anaerolineae bacterium]